jgi:hypothetical protein
MCAHYQINCLAIIKRNQLHHAESYKLQHIGEQTSCSANFEQCISPMFSHLRPSLQNVRFSKPEIAELNSLSTGDFPLTCSSFASVDMRIGDDI